MSILNTLKELVAVFSAPEEIEKMASKFERLEAKMGEFTSAISNEVTEVRAKVQLLRDEVAAMASAEAAEDAADTSAIDAIIGSIDTHIDNIGKISDDP